MSAFYLPENALRLAFDDLIFDDFTCFAEQFPQSCGNYELSMMEDNIWMLQEFLNTHKARLKLDKKTAAELMEGLLAYAVTVRLNGRFGYKYPCVVHSYPLTDNPARKIHTKCSSKDWLPVHNMWEKLGAPIILSGKNPNTQRWTVMRSVMPPTGYDLVKLFPAIKSSSCIEHHINEMRSVDRGIFD